MTSRRQWLTLAAATLALGAALPVLAQSFPAKPVNLMVPYPAGGTSDRFARVLNTPLAEALKQPVIVENVGGASGAIAAQKVLAAPADGYYLYQGSPNELILAPLVNKAIKFKSEDFQLINMLGTTQIAFLARKDLPANSVDEFVDYARKQAAAGKPITYASVGPGSLYHLLGAYMSKVTGIPMTHVPYRGGAPAMQDLIGGQVDIYLAPFGPQYPEFARQGKLKILATLTDQKLPSNKDYPLISESKQLKHFNFSIWTGYFVKKGTPEPVMQMLHDALAKVVAQPAVATDLEASNLTVDKPASRAELAKIYVQLTQQYRDIAKSIDLKAE